ncbi:hypothetical protein ACFPN0_28385 [Kitasatospora cinereorecta]
MTRRGQASVNLDVLAPACHARRRGWAIRVESPTFRRISSRPLNRSRALGQGPISPVICSA